MINLGKKFRLYQVCSPTTLKQKHSMNYKDKHLQMSMSMAIKKNNALLGNGIFPTWQEKMDYWKYRVQTIPHNSYIYVLDLKKNRTILNHGFSVLGYSEDKEYTMLDIATMAHPNQNLIVNHYIWEVYKILPDLKDQIGKKNFGIRLLRSIKDASGEYWLTSHSTEPFQFDKNGNITSYFGWGHKLEKYSGEPIAINVYYKDSNSSPKELSLLQKEMDKIKSSILPYLGFTKAQIHILEILALTDSNAHTISVARGTSIRTIEKHSQNILTIAKSVFPLNSFINAKSVAIYLYQQGLI